MNKLKKKQNEKRTQTMKDIEERDKMLARERRSQNWNTVNRKLDTDEILQVEHQIDAIMTRLKPRLYQMCCTRLEVADLKRVFAQIREETAFDLPKSEIPPINLIKINEHSMDNESMGMSMQLPHNHSYEQNDLSQYSARRGSLESSRQYNDSSVQLAYKDALHDLERIDHPSVPLGRSALTSAKRVDSEIGSSVV